MSNNGTTYLVEMIEGGDKKNIIITKECQNVTLISLPVDFQSITIRVNEEVGPKPPHGPWEQGIQSPTMRALIFAKHGLANKRVAVVGVVEPSDENHCNSCYRFIQVGHMFVQSACAVALHGCFDTNGKRVNSRDPYWRVYCCTKKCIDPRTCPPKSYIQYVGAGTKGKTSQIVNAALK